MPVFHRVEVDVIDMLLQVIFVADLMFPIAPLPKVVFAFFILEQRYTLFHQGVGKMTFNGSPTAGVVVVIFWQLNDGVEVIG